MGQKETKVIENPNLLSLLFLNHEEPASKQIRRLYIISNHVERNYKKHFLKKKNGTIRTIYEPSFWLKKIQRHILHTILKDLEVSKYACAYRSGYHLRDNARVHTGKKMILKLDIQDFFDSISFMDIYHFCFSFLPKNVGMLCTYLCTYFESLPQGAPTSPKISNLVMKDFDEKVGKYCEERTIFYTRYSDDMTFSGDFQVLDLIRFVRKELSLKGLMLNPQKIHVIHKSQCQRVTGVVVNQKMQVAKSYRKKIRQSCYYIQKFGLDSHMMHVGCEKTKLKYLNELLGKIHFVLQINPEDKEAQVYKAFLIGLRKNYNH